MKESRAEAVEMITHDMAWACRLREELPDTVHTHQEILDLFRDGLYYILASTEDKDIPIQKDRWPFIYKHWADFVRRYKIQYLNLENNG